MLLKFGLWLFIQLSRKTVCICLVMFVWLFHVGRYCSPAMDIIFDDTHDQFPLGRAHPLQVVFRWWFMLLTGSFWSPVVTWKDVADRPSVSRGRARCIIFSPPPTPLPPRIYVYSVKCERNNIYNMWKKKPSAPFLAFNSSSGWGIWKNISHGGSLNLRGSLLLPERATSATGVGCSLCSSSTGRSLRADPTSTSCFLMSWMWRRPFLCHPIRDRRRTYAAIDGGSPPRATPLHSFGNLEPVRKEQWVHKKKAISIDALLSYSLLQRLASLTLRAWMFPPVFNERRIHLAISFRRSQEELSAVGLALFIWLEGSISTRKKKNSSVTSDLSWPSTRLESFDVHFGKFSAEIDRDTTRTIASPQRAFFPWQLGVRKFTDLPDCCECEVRSSPTTGTHHTLSTGPSGTQWILARAPRTQTRTCTSSTWSYHGLVITGQKRLKSSLF